MQGGDEECFPHDSNAKYFKIEKPIKKTMVGEAVTKLAACLS